MVDHDRLGDVQQPRVAGLVVEVFPLPDSPGTVGLSVHNIGPEKLDQLEAVIVLQHALQELKVSTSWKA